MPNLRQHLRGLHGLSRAVCLNESVRTRQAFASSISPMLPIAGFGDTCLKSQANNFIGHRDRSSQGLWGNYLTSTSLLHSHSFSTTPATSFFWKSAPPHQTENVSGVSTSISPSSATLTGSDPLETVSQDTLVTKVATLPADAAESSQAAVAAVQQVSEVAAITSDWANIRLLMQLLEYVHDMSGLPWWVTIIATTLALRTAILPVGAYAVRNTARLQLAAVDLEPRQEEFTNLVATGIQDPELTKERNRYMRDVAAIYSKHGTNPVSAMLPLMFQGPLFISFFYALHNMSEHCPSFQTGGPAMIPYLLDLSVPDPYCILPVLNAASFLLLAEFGMADGMENNPAADKIKGFMRVLGVAMIPMTMDFSTGVFVYWMTSNVYSAGQSTLLRHPDVKRYIGIPDTSHIQTPEKEAKAQAEALKKMLELKVLPQGLRPHKKKKKKMT